LELKRSTPDEFILHLLDLAPVTAVTAALSEVEEENCRTPEA